MSVRERRGVIIRWDQVAENGIKGKGADRGRKRRKRARTGDGGREGAGEREEQLILF